MIQKISFPLVLCIFLLVPVKFVPAQNQFTFSHPANFPADMVAVIKSLVQQSTGKNWASVTNQPIQQGLLLSINPEGSYTTGESCILTANGTDFVHFQAPTVNGLIFGVYRYLRDLGFRFYLPDENYTIIPAGVNLLQNKPKHLPLIYASAIFLAPAGLAAVKLHHTVQHLARQNFSTSDFRNNCIFYLILLATLWANSFS